MTSLTDAVKYAIDFNLANVHTCLPAQIISYDYQKKKAQVKPVISKRWTDGNFSEMPIINGVPVIFPSSGGASLTFPVKEGDFCLLVFAERNIDLWKTEGRQNPMDSRKFNLSDAIAIMGITPFFQESKAENNQDVLLTYQNSKVRIKESGEIQLETSGKIAIGTAQNELLDILSETLGYLANSLSTSVGTPFTFSTQWAALKAKIDQIKGSL